MVARSPARVRGRESLSLLRGLLQGRWEATRFGPLTVDGFAVSYDSAPSDAVPPRITPTVDGIALGRWRAKVDFSSRENTLVWTLIDDPSGKDVIRWARTGVEARSEAAPSAQNTRQQRLKRRELPARSTDSLATVPRKRRKHEEREVSVTASVGSKAAPRNAVADLGLSVELVDSSARKCAEFPDQTVADARSHYEDLCEKASSSCSSSPSGREGWVRRMRRDRHERASETEAHRDASGSGQAAPISIEPRQVAAAASRAVAAGAQVWTGSAPELPTGPWVASTASRALVAANTAFVEECVPPTCVRSRSEPVSEEECAATESEPRALERHSVAQPDGSETSWEARDCLPDEPWLAANARAVAAALGMDADVTLNRRRSSVAEPWQGAGLQSPVWTTDVFGSDSDTWSADVKAREARSPTVSSRASVRSSPVRQGMHDPAHVEHPVARKSSRGVEPGVATQSLLACKEFVPRAATGRDASDREPPVADQSDTQLRSTFSPEQGLDGHNREPDRRAPSEQCHGAVSELCSRTHGSGTGGGSVRNVARTRGHDINVEAGVGGCESAGGPSNFGPGDEPAQTDALCDPVLRPSLDEGVAEDVSLLKEGFPRPSSSQKVNSLTEDISTRPQGTTPGSAGRGMPQARPSATAGAAGLASGSMPAVVPSELRGKDLLSYAASVAPLCAHCRNTLRAVRHIGEVDGLYCELCKARGTGPEGSAALLLCDGGRGKAPGERSCAYVICARCVVSPSERAQKESLWSHRKRHFHISVVIGPTRSVW